MRPFDDSVFFKVNWPGEADAPDDLLERYRAVRKSISIYILHKKLAKYAWKNKQMKYNKI